MSAPERGRGGVGFWSQTASALLPALWLRPGGGLWGGLWLAVALAALLAAAVHLRRWQLHRGAERWALVQELQRERADLAQDLAASQSAAEGVRALGWKDLRAQAEAAGVLVEELRLGGDGNSLEMRGSAAFAAWRQFRAGLEGFRVRYEELVPSPKGQGLQVRGSYEPLGPGAGQGEP